MMRRVAIGILGLLVVALGAEAGWQKERREDKLTLKAATVWGLEHSAGSLIVKCWDSGTLEAALVGRTFLSSLQQPVRIQFRFDDQAMRAEEWLVFGDHRVAYSRAPVAFVASIRDRNRLYLRAYAYDTASEDYEFALTGATAADVGGKCYTDGVVRMKEAAAEAGRGREERAARQREEQARRDAEDAKDLERVDDLLAVLCGEVDAASKIDAPRFPLGLIGAFGEMDRLARGLKIRQREAELRQVVTTGADCLARVELLWPNAPVIFSLRRLRALVGDEPAK